MVLRSKKFQHGAGKLLNIVCSTSERRQLNLYSIQPVKKIFTKTTFFYSSFKLRISGSNNPDIGFPCFLFTYPFIFPILNKTEKFWLNSER